MVFITISDNVESCYSNEDGKKIYTIIYKSLIDSRKIKISFEGINSVTSSFVNSAFIELLENFTFDYIKNNIEFSNTSKPIKDVIKKRFAFENEKKRELVNN